MKCVKHVFGSITDIFQSILTVKLLQQTNASWKTKSKSLSILWVLIRDWIQKFSKLWTSRQISWRWQNACFRSGSILHNEDRFHTPTCVPFQMTVHKPHPWKIDIIHVIKKVVHYLYFFEREITWIISKKSNRGPSILRNSKGVYFWWIIQIVCTWGRGSIEISITCPNQIEAKTM